MLCCKRVKKGVKFTAPMSDGPQYFSHKSNRRRAWRSYDMLVDDSGDEISVVILTTILRCSLKETTRVARVGDVIEQTGCGKGQGPSADSCNHSASIPKREENPAQIRRGLSTPTSPTDNHNTVEVDGAKVIYIPRGQDAKPAH